MFFIAPDGQAPELQAALRLQMADAAKLAEWYAAAGEETNRGRTAAAAAAFKKLQVFLKPFASKPKEAFVAKQIGDLLTESLSKFPTKVAVCLDGCTQCFDGCVSPLLGR